MKSLLVFTFFALSGLYCSAQHYHFVYLQTDNKQTFYIRLNEKLYSSSSSGYVVIPKLPAGSHTLSIGFPKNEWPAQNITINIANKDLGFSLKNFESKGWGLFNLQTLQVITTSSSETNQKQASSTELKTDEFSNVLADVVNTPSIKEQNKSDINPVPPAKLEIVKKEDPLITEEKKLEAIPKPASQLEEGNKEIPVTNTESKPEPVSIKKISSATDGEGMIIVYLDSQSAVTDTISIFIPHEKINADALLPVKDVKEPVQSAENAKRKDEVEIKPDRKTNTPKFIDIDLPVANSQEDQSAAKSKVQESGIVTGNAKISDEKFPSTPAMINSDCRQLANEVDFLKIRKKMGSQKTDDDMVSVAKKMFSQKCYSTEQIKSLSSLFLKDEGKYKLFDASYPHVYDSQQFKQLEFLLTDQYIISRFRAMIRN